MTRNTPESIHLRLAAAACTDAVDCDQRETDVGAPDVVTYRAVAEFAVTATGGTAQISHVAVWVMKTAASLAWRFNRHQGGLLRFFVTAVTSDAVAPPAGTHSLVEHFRSMAGAKLRRSTLRSHV